MSQYNYPELQTESFDNKRWYLTPAGAYYPSITTVLGTTQSEAMTASLENWRNSLGHEKAAAHSKRAADRGTNVHLLAERYLKKEDVFAPIHGQKIPDLDKAAFNALKLKLDKVDEVWGQECTLYSEALEVGGRCDLVGKYKSVPVIVDFKTAGKIKSKADIGDYCLQLAFYGIAHNEMFGTNIQDGVILMVAQTGFPMEFNIKLSEHYEELQTRIAEFWKKVLNSSVLK